MLFLRELHILLRGKEEHLLKLKIISDSYDLPMIEEWLQKVGYLFQIQKWVNI
jgi:hypothetical protein